MYYLIHNVVGTRHGVSLRMYFVISNETGNRRATACPALAGRNLNKTKDFSPDFVGIEMTTDLFGQPLIEICLILVKNCVLL